MQEYENQSQLTKIHVQKNLASLNDKQGNKLISLQMPAWQTNHAPTSRHHSDIHKANYFNTKENIY